MWRTFNMGLGIVFAIDPKDADTVRSALPEALIVGEVVKERGGERTIIE